MNLIPLNGTVIVKRHEGAKKSAGGIIIPEKSLDVSALADVVAVADNYHGLAVGDTVVLGKFDGEELVHEGVKYVLISDASIKAKVNK